MTASKIKNKGSLQILAHGEGWLAVEKPAGISVHNDPGLDLCAHVTQLCCQHTEIIDYRYKNQDFGFHPVHRLDRETSGVVLLAYHRETFRFLSDQFGNRKIKKKYTALLHGAVGSPADT